jgi:hypothetical protein
MALKLAALAALASFANADYGDPRKGACAAGDSESPPGPPAPAGLSRPF